MSRAVDLLGERWTMLIMRDLLTGTSHFNDLARGLPGLSRSLLTKRLRRLEHAGLVERLDGQYHLTDAGDALRPIVFGLGEWAAQYIFGDPQPFELDAELLVWWMHKRIDPRQLPDRRTVLHVRFADDPRRYWIVVDAQGPSVCDIDPGFEVDVTIRADVDTLHRVWLGREPMTHAMRPAGSPSKAHAPSPVACPTHSSSAPSPARFSPRDEGIAPRARVGQGRVRFNRTGPDDLNGRAGVTANRPHPATVTPLGDATIVMYADGLFERRGETVDIGLQRLATNTASITWTTLVGLLDDLIRRPHPPTTARPSHRRHRHPRVPTRSGRNAPGAVTPVRERGIRPARRHPTMHKVTVQYFDPADGDAVENAYRERHVPLVKAVPGLERFTISLPHADGAPIWSRSCGSPTATPWAPPRPPRRWLRCGPNPYHYPRHKTSST